MRRVWHNSSITANLTKHTLNTIGMSLNKSFFKVLQDNKEQCQVETITHKTDFLKLLD